MLIDAYPSFSLGKAPCPFGASFAAGCTRTYFFREKQQWLQATNDSPGRLPVDYRYATYFVRNLGWDC